MPLLHNPIEPPPGDDPGPECRDCEGTGEIVADDDSHQTCPRWKMRSRRRG